MKTTIEFTLSEYFEVYATLKVKADERFERTSKNPDHYFYGSDDYKKETLLLFSVLNKLDKCEFEY